MTSRRAVELTARREVRERWRSRAFRVGLAIQVVIVLAIVVVAALSAGDDETTYDVGLVGPRAEAIGAQLAAEPVAGVKIDESRPANASEARAAVEDGDLDAAVEADDLLVASGTDQELETLIQAAAAKAEGEAVLRRSGADSEQIERALNPTPLPTSEVGGEGDSGSGLAFAGSLLLYLAILGFGFVVTSGIVEEKSSRVVELIVSAIRPSQLLAGKVIGIGLLGFFQLAVVAGLGIAAALLSGQLELPTSALATVLLVLLYFVLGYALYACAFAVAGAIVSRQEDVGSVTTPVTIVLVVGYLASFSIADDPGGALATICTLFPPTAPMVVPARAAVDGLPAWELAVSVVLMLASVVVLIRLAGRIYERAVLMVGSPMRLVDGLRLARRPG